MDSEGTIERKANGSFVVTVLNAPASLEQRGVTCINSDAPENERLYQKTFVKKPIYLPADYENAVKDYVVYPDNFVISMNGYSKISDDQCVRYGIQKGAYEEACRALMSRTIGRLRDKFSGASLRLIHGASDLGVDRAVQFVADEFNIVPLGFSCPRFMLYVNDDLTPVYVAPTKDEYADRYIQTLDLLIATGGREHALQHDVLAACVYNKRIHFIDVLNSLSSTGGVPATICGADGRLKVDNAAAAMGRNISFFTRHDGITLAKSNGDLWDAIFDNVEAAAIEACRQKMSPERKFR